MTVVEKLKDLFARATASYSIEESISRGHLFLSDLTEQQRTPEVCVAAVSRNGLAIQDLNDSQRTPEVCLAAVRQDPRVIQLLSDAHRTSEICLEAVKRHSHVVTHLNSGQRTPEVCLEVVRSSADAFVTLAADQATVRAAQERIHSDASIFSRAVIKQDARGEVYLWSVLEERSKAILHLTQEEFCLPLVSDWVLANQELTAKLLGDKRASEVVGAIFHERDPLAQMERPRG